jgi:hypothetical protein
MRQHKGVAEILILSADSASHAPKKFTLQPQTTGLLHATLSVKPGLKRRLRVERRNGKIAPPDDSRRIARGNRRFSTNVIVFVR